jgi:hypothetical protein
MKHFFLTLTFGALLSSCMVGQETEKLFTPESLIEYVKEGVNLQEWTLESISLKFDNEENNLDYSKALLIAKFSNNSNNDLKKKYGFEFKRGDYDYLLAVGIKHTCSGVNCSECEITGVFDIGCKCDKISHPEGGPSYCNHTVTTGLSHSGWGLIDHESILIETNEKL